MFQNLNSLSSYKEFLKILNEGGNAFSSVYYFNHSDKESIKHTIVQILEKMKIQKYSIAGSFKNKEVDIGDVDVVIYDERYSFESLDDTYKNLDLIGESALDSFEDVKISKTLGVYSVLAEVESQKKIQIDFIPVPSLEWGEWSYYSPSKEESSYKGLYRNALLEAIAKTLHFDVIKYGKEDSNEFIEEGSIKSYFRFRYLRNAGLWKVKEYNKGKKKLNYAKDRDTYELVTYKPNQVISILLGEELKASNYMTFESVLNHISNPTWKYYKKIKTILENFKIIIVDRQRNPLPQEVRELMKFLKLKVSEED